MAKIWIDGVEHEIDPSKNLLEGCLEKGKNLPYFCWHPALGSVGACRQCAVKQYRDENDKQGKLVMACMTPAAEGTRISIADPEAAAFRKGITEFLMVNHPHDCPVCDEGGECHLQDMTVMTGHKMRTYRFTKRTYTNQDLGPLVNHEMNRCIQCYRCVHYYRDHAGGKDLQAFAAHDHVYFGRHEDGMLESEFSGNLVEVCPTGVFTDKTLKSHYARKWDLTTAPSVCVHCSLGCNTIPGARYGTLRRIRNRYHGDVNGYFLCDRGRFGYEFVNDDRRLRHPTVRGASGPERAPEETAVQRVAGLVRGGNALGIGSPRASLESNAALRALVGPDRFFAGVPAAEGRLVAAVLGILRTLPAPSLRGIESCDAVFVLGEDVTNTAPMADLAIRQAIKNQPRKAARKQGIPGWHAVALRIAVQEAKGPLFVATTAPTKLDAVAAGTFRGAPDDLARFGLAVAHALDPTAPEPAGLPAETAAAAKRVADALRTAERPVVVSGTGARSEAVLAAAAAVARAAGAARDGRAAEIFCAVPECNSLGLALFEAPPLEDAFAALERGTSDTVIVAENDLTRRLPAVAADRFFAAAKHLVVVDSLLNATAERAEVLLPAGTFAEADGTLVNNEGRAQRFYQVFVPETEIRETWRWLGQVARAAGRADGAWDNLDAATASVAAALPACAKLAAVAPPASARFGGAKIPRETHRFSGRTAMRAHLGVHEPKPPADPDSPLSFSMEGFEGRVPAAVTSNFWAPGWNSIQSLNRFQEELGGALAGGNPGLKLIEAGANGSRPAYGAAPAAFAPRTGEWLAVPSHHIFGSEELSALSPGIADAAAPAALALGAEDAAALSLAEGAAVSVTVDGVAAKLPVRIVQGMPRGVCGIPAGVAGVPVVPLPAWARIVKS